MEARFVVLNHGMTHEESMQVDGRRGKGQLRQLQHDTDLCDEIDTLLPVGQLLRDWHPLEDTRRKEKFVWGEQPLRLRSLEDRIGQKMRRDIWSRHLAETGHGRVFRTQRWRGRWVKEDDG
jgi:hypothetical protein